MRIRIGDLLVKAGVITDAQLKSALAEQHQWGGKLGDILVRMEFVTEEVLVRALSKQSGIPRADLTGEAPGAALSKVPPEMAEEFGLVPLALQDEGRTLVVAMSDPLNIMVTDHLRSMTGCRVVAQIAGTQAIRDAISRWYRGHSLGTEEDPASIRIINNAGGAVTVTNTGLPKVPTPVTAAGLPRPLPQTQPPPPPPSNSGAPKPISVSGLKPIPAAVTTAGRPKLVAAAAISSSGSRPGATQPPPPTSPGVQAPPPPPPAPSAVEILRGVEETQRRSVAALKAMVELLIEKGVFSRDEYLGRVKR